MGNAGGVDVEGPVEDGRIGGEGGDPLPLSAQAHFLKSMALSAGASAVAAMAEQLEHDAKAGRMDASNSALLPLRAKLEETCAAMRARMEAPPKDAAVG